MGRSGSVGRDIGLLYDILRDEKQVDKLIEVLREQAKGRERKLDRQKAGQPLGADSYHVRPPTDVKSLIGAAW